MRFSVGWICVGVAFFFLRRPAAPFRVVLRLCDCMQPLYDFALIHGDVSFFRVRRVARAVDCYYPV